MFKALLVAVSQSITSIVCPFGTVTPQTHTLITQEILQQNVGIISQCYEQGLVSEVNMNNILTFMEKLPNKDLQFAPACKVPAEVAHTVSNKFFISKNLLVSMGIAWQECLKGLKEIEKKKSEI